MTNEKDVKKALEKQTEIENSCYNGRVEDSDTELKDFLDEVDNTCLTGVAAEIYNVWLESKDRKSVEELFELLVDISFTSFVKFATKKMDGTLERIEEYQREQDEIVREEEFREEKYLNSVFATKPA